MSRSVEFLVFDNYSECPPVTKAAFAFHLCFLALAFAFQVFNKYNSSLAQMFQRVKKLARLLGQHLTLIGGDTSTRRGLQVLRFQIPWNSHDRSECTPCVQKTFDLCNFTFHSY